MKPVTRRRLPIHGAEAYRQYCELWHTINGADVGTCNYWVKGL